MEIGHIENLVWMPVRTKPRREKKVREFCEANSIPCYLPLRRTLHRYERKTVEFFVPMFPGYVFCALDEERHQRLLRSNAILFRITLDERGEKGLLEEFKAIRAFEEMSKNADVIVKPELVSGSRVAINAGPMRGVSGVVDRRKGKALLSVNIDILGQSVSVEVDAGELELEEIV